MAWPAFDTSELAPTSAKPGLRWRDTALTWIWLRPNASIVVAHTIEDKRRVLDGYSDEDCLLAVRPVRYPPREEVMVVDDLDTARAALGAT